MEIEHRYFTEALEIAEGLLGREILDDERDFLHGFFKAGRNAQFVADIDSSNIDGELY